MDSNQTDIQVLVLVRDLIFATKIRGTAEALGRSVLMLRDPVKLSQHDARLLIVDLNLPGVIPLAAHWQSQGDSNRKVVGFVSHVDADTIARARAAGLDRVLPRSRFVEELPALLA